MKIVNLTQHEIVFHPPFGEKRVLLPSGTVARVSVAEQNVVGLALECEEGYFLAPAKEEVWGEVTGLPEQDDEHMYIVSTLVQMRVPDRPDVLAPMTLVRNEEGKVVGCSSFRLTPAGIEKEERERRRRAYELQQSHAKIATENYERTKHQDKVPDHRIEKWD